MKIPATAAAVTVAARCPTIVAITWHRQGRIVGLLRRPVGRRVVCGVNLEIVPNRMRVQCPKCAHHAKRYLDRTVAIPSPPLTVWTFTRKQRERAMTTARRWVA